MLAGPEGFEPPTYRLEAGTRSKKGDSANTTTFRTFAFERHFSPHAPGVFTPVAVALQ